MRHRGLQKAVYESAAGDARALARLRMNGGCMVYVVKTSGAKLKELHDRDAKMAAGYGRLAARLQNMSVRLAGNMSMGQVCGEAGAGAPHM